ncbi:DUF7619 domain-containing protein [Flavobacterium sp.]
MKKLYAVLLFALIGMTSQAQIINFPDANFKAKLLQANTSNSIAKNLSGSSFKIDANNDGEIQVSEALQVSILSVSNSLIISLEGISNFTNLYKLYCLNNQLTSLNLTAQVNLNELQCQNNQISSLTINTLSSLSTLYCNNNQLTSLNLSGCNALGSLICNDNLLNTLTLPVSGGSFWYLDCKNNQLSSLVLTNYNNLQTVICSNNLITTLSVSTPYLQEIRCNNNQLLTLNTNNLLNLAVLDCSFNFLNEVDISNNKVVNYLKCSNNQLRSLNIKNGRTLTTQIISNNSTLRYICCDDSRVDATLANAFQNGYPHGTVEVNSYCSFTPGGPFFTIGGFIKYDSNSNGCDILDISYPNLRLNVSNGSAVASLIANTTGNYSIPVQAGTYSMAPAIENPSYYIISPESSSVTFAANSSSLVQNFCIVPNGVHKDLEVTIVPITSIRPGFNATFKLVCKNKGTHTQSGTVQFTFEDDKMDFVSSDSAVVTQTTDNINFSYTNLLPTQTQEITVVMNINSPLETPAVIGGDKLGFYSIIFPVDEDELLDDNYTHIKTTVVNAFDPNDKTCLEGEIITPSMVGQYVHYVIRFENTGTFAAENIVVTDAVDLTKFDLNTLIAQSSSYPFITRINATTGKVEFIFENINLPFDDANNDGYLAFKIKTKPTLLLGDTFTNTANIYFDYNFPILTNTAVTTIAALNVQDFEFGSYFTIYPIPAKEMLNITVNGQIEVKAVEIYTTLGQLVLAYTTANNLSSLDVSQLKTGTYFIKLTTDKGTVSKQFVKQ